jgi:hypothetical protein
VAVLNTVHRLIVVPLALLTGLSFACTARGSKQEPSAKAEGAEPASDVALRGSSGPHQEPNPEAESPRDHAYPALPSPPAVSAAYFHFSTGIYRLDDQGWTRIFGPADRLLRGREGGLHAVDRVGVHRLTGEGHTLLHVIEEGGASKALFDASEHVEVGPYGELWELLRRERRWIVERVDLTGAVARWEESGAVSWSDTLELVVDGDGRAWFVPAEADGPLHHKGPQSDWATISTWQREGETHEPLAAASDGRSGVWILTKVALLHVDADAKITRLSLPKRGHWQAADLAINETGEAVVRDAACFLDLYSLWSDTVEPKSLGQYRGYACGETPMVLALDSQQRTWLRISDSEVSVWTPEGREVVVDGPGDVERLDEVELVSVVVVGAGPALAP